MMKNPLARIATILAFLIPLTLAAETLVGVLPVAGSTPGAFGARFRTTLQLSNPSAETIRGSVVFHRQGFPGAPSDPRLPFELAPHATRSWADVVEEMGASGLGSIDIFVDEGPRPVAVARAFADGDGTRGNTIPLMRPEEALQIGESATLLVPSDLERFRFNLGVRSLSRGARLRIRAYDAAGNPVGAPEALSIPPDYFEQRPGAGFLGAALPPNGSLVVRIEEGSAIVYGTTTDNRTNDPSFQLDRRMNKRPRLVGATVERRPDGTARIRMCVSDPDGDRVAVTVAVPPATGTLGPIEEDGAGCVATIFSGGGTGGASIGFALTDTDENVTLIDVDVAGGGNRAPVAHAQLVSVPEDGTRAIVLTGTDPDSDPLTYSIVSGPSHGTLTGAPPNVTYRPAPNYNGPDSFTFRVTDGVESASGVVSIIVTAVNDAPLAGDLSVTTAEDTPAPITLAGTDIDGDALQFSIGSAPSRGTLSGTSPNLVYTPAANFNGADSFTFFVSDGRASSAAAQVSIVVTPVNDAPVATGGPVATDEDTPVAIALTATDVDGDLLTWTVTAPAHGSLSGAAPNLTYAPAANYAGPDAIVFSASDGRLTSGSATIAITVRPVSDSPAAAADVYATAQGVTLNVAAPGILANDTDPEGDALSATLASAPPSGTLTLSANGSFTYAPAAGFTGTVSFTYRAGDGTTQSAPATVSINVNAANAPPSAAGQTIATAEDAALAVVLTGTDPDGDAIGFAIAAAPANGTLTGTPPNVTYAPAPDFSGSDSFSFTVTDGVATSARAVVSITVTPVNDPPSAFADVYGTAAGSPLTVSAPGVLANDTDIDGGALRAVVESVPANGTLTLNLDGSFTYTPAALFSGIDGFDYRAGDGIATSAPAHVTINVSASNASPVATAASVTTNEDAATGITLTGTDPDGDALGFAVVTAPANGALSGAAPNLAYAPNADFNGSDSFTFTATDGIATSAPATIAITVAPVNDLPVAADESYATNEDTALTVVAPGVLANDADIDGNPLAAILVTPPANGVATLGADGSLAYTPAANFHGADQIAYRVNDGTGDSNVAHAAITVLPVNDDPVAAADAATVNEDSGATAIAVLANDTFAPDSGETLTITATGATSSGGVVTIVGGTSLSYTPAPNFAGTETFTYTISDGNGGSATATVTVTVANINDAPTAADDAVTVGEDSGASALAVLANDSILPDAGETLAITGVTQGANGTVAITGGGTGLTYQPNANYFGGDSFTYTISDGNGGVDTATVTVTVTSVNDNPTAAADAATVAEDSAGNAIAVLGNDSFAPDTGETLTITGTGATSNGGAVTIVGGTSLSYTPAPNFFGTETFTYTISDGNGGSATATVTVTVTNVNDNPSAAADAFTVAEDSSSNALAVLANDSVAPDTGETLSITGTGATSNGGVVAIVGGTSLSYTPAANFFGTETFTYTIGDGNGGTATATVTVTVTNVNDAPDAIGDAATIAEDAGASAINVLANDSILPDASETLTITSVTQGTNGAVVITGGGSGLTYQPNANYFGGDSFTYTISDGNGGADTATVTVTVTSVNDAPVVTGATFAIDENTANGTSVGTPITATDVESNGISWSITGGNTGGAFAIGAASGQITVANVGALDRETTPSFSLTVTATDNGTPNAPGSATVTINLNNLNDTAPVANGDGYTVAEGATLNVALSGVIANDTDADGATTFAAALVAGPNRGALTLNANGSFSYVHDGSHVASDSFTYRVSDGVQLSNVATVTLTITLANDAPVAAGNAYAVAQGGTLAVAAAGVLANDTDEEGNPLTAVLATGPASATSFTLNANGSFNYVHNGVGTTPDSFTYRANDGTSSSSAVTVTIAVTASNAAPVANGDSYSVTDGGTLTIAAPGVLADDTDAEGNALTAAVVTTTANGTLTLGSGGGFTYVHTPGAGGDSFTYRANDGQASSNLATVTITILPGANAAPTAVADGYAIAQGGTLAITASGVLGNDSDPDGNALSVSLVTGTTNGTLTLSPNGSFTYVHSGNAAPSDSFTYVANDGQTNSAPATVTITINATNAAPTAGSDGPYATSQNRPLTVAAPGVLANDADADGNPIHPVRVSGPANGTLTLNADGSFSYLPNLGYIGGDSFTYRASDGALESSVATVTINVLANAAPVAVADAYSVDEDTALAVAAAGVLANDTDTETDPLTAILVSGPTNAASFTLNANGSFSYTPNANVHGGDSFTYKANDGQDSNVATVTLTIDSVNDAPSFATGGNVTVDEDSGAYAAAWAGSISAGPANESTQTLTFNVSLSATSSTLTFSSAPAIASNGTLSFTPAANAYGTTTVTVTLSDNGGTANGGVNTSASQQFTLTVTGINDAPVVTAGGALAYTENGAAAAIDGTITVADTDSTNLASATVQITGNYDSGKDVLSYATALGITGAWNATSGTLTLTGATTPANYQIALRNVKFENTSDNPSTAARTVTWIVNDGAGANNTSAPVVSTITVSAVDDPFTMNTVGTLTTWSGIPVTFPTDTLGGSDPDSGTTYTVDTTPGTVTGGAVVLNANGSFTFTPSAGVTGNGSGSFTYRACDTTPTCSSYATVTFNVGGPPLYFVKAAAVGAGNCTLGAECTLATAQASIGASTGRTIFISDSASHNTAVALNASGTLMGQGVTGASFDALFSITPASASPGTLATRPLINQTAPTIQQTVTLGASSSLRGVSITTSGVTGLTAGAVASPSASEVAISSTGAAAIVLNGTTSANLSFSSVSSSGAANGVSLTSVTGTVGASGGTITGSGSAFLVSGGTVGGTWSGTISQANNALALDIASHATGALTFATVSATNGTGIRFNNADGTYSVTTATLNGGDAGIDVLGGSSGTISFGGASSVTNPSGSLFDIQSSSPAFTYAGSFSKTSTGVGINVQNNTGGTIAFSGSGVTKTLSTSTSTAINLASNTGATVNFTGGGLSVTTTTGTGFNATGGGTVTVQGSTNTVTSGTGAAVNIASTTIGASGVTFQSVSVSGGTTGILLNTTGAGPFNVTGVGTTAGSGGTIANTSARGASFTSASNVSLKNMNSTNAATATVGTCVANAASGSNATCNAPIHLASVTTAALDRLVVSGSAQMGINANAVSGLTLTNSTISSIGSSAAGEHTAVLLQNMSGTSSITGNTITNNDFGHNVFVTSNTGLMTLNFRANTVSTTSGTPANSDGFQAQGYNSASMTIVIDNTGGTCSFDRLWANGVEIGANDTSTVTATLSGCNVSRTNGILMDGNGSSVLTATVTNNQVRNKSIALDGFGNGSNGITVTKVAGSTGRVVATITGNQIQRANCGGGCHGIAATNQGGGGTASTFVISNNTVENVDEVGIRFVTGGGSPKSVLTMEGNNITNPSQSGGYAIDIFHGTNAGDTPCLAADIGTMNGGLANTISNGSTGFQWINIAGAPTIGPIKNQGGSFLLFGYAGATDAAAASYIVSHNPGTSSDAAGGFSGGTNCP